MDEKKNGRKRGERHKAVSWGRGCVVAIAGETKGREDSGEKGRQRYVRATDTRCQMRGGGQQKDR